MNNRFTKLRQGLALTVLLAAGSLAARAQNVGIGTTAPDASAALDIVSTTKGALLPRVASTGSVSSPATGLIVFQTGGTAGYYYNAGTPGTPSWQQLATASGAAVTVGNGLTKTGQNIALGGTLSGATTVALGANNLTFSSTSGTVGIGASSAARLHVRGTGNAYPAITGTTQSAGLISRFQTSDNAILDLGGNSGNGLWLQSTDITALNLNYPLLLNPNGGNVGIGTTAPTARLDVEAGGLLVGGFAAIASQGAHLQWNRTGFEGETWLINQYGVGTAQNFGIRFGNSDQSNNLTEWARFDKLGNFSIGVPFTAGQGPGANKLDVNGSTRLRGLTTAGVVTTDASGNLGSATAITAFGTNFIQNTTTQQTANFNLSGAGTVGGLLTAGSATVAGNIQSSANIAVDAGNANTGTVANTLRFGPVNSGEAIGSKRTSGGNQFGLDFYTTSTARMSITTAGNVGIGTTAPVAGLQVDMPQAPSAAGLGVILSGGTSGNPSIELRGNGDTPFVDFSETTGVDYSTRLISSGGTLSVNNANAAVPALNVAGYTKLTGPAAITGATVPGIATALFTGNLPAADNTNVGVSLGGIATSRVLSVSVTALSPNGNYFPPNQSTAIGFGTGYEYGYYLETSSNTLRLAIGTNAANVKNAAVGAVKILVTYQQ